MTGRDHHPHSFAVWMAVAGVKRGYVHGRTDELGFYALEDAHYATDIHATAMHLMGLKSKSVDIPGPQAPGSRLRERHHADSELKRRRRLRLAEHCGRQEC